MAYRAFRRMLACAAMAAPLHCAGQPGPSVSEVLVSPPLVDKNATQAVRDLYTSLLNVMLQQVGPSGNGGITATMFGHQDDLALGYNWNYVEHAPIKNPPDSDVFFATDRQYYPKVFGFDLGNIYHTNGKNVDGLDKGDIARWVRKAHSMGGVITMTMHNDNPMTGGRYDDHTPGTVASILPGGPNNEKWLGSLDSLADFIEALSPIPILFRPYHEPNKGFSWWGWTACNRTEYIKLWDMTVQHWLQRPTWAHNVLFVFAPQDITVVGSGNLNNQWEYFARYPGDDHVDVLGFDSYQIWNWYEAGTALDRVINYSTGHMRQAGYLKPVALTEAGQMAPPNLKYNRTTYDPPDWWTGNLEKALGLTNYRLAWVLVWRNAYHYAVCFVPAVKSSGGSVCELPDFKSFVQNTVVEGKKVQMLKLPGAGRRMQVQHVGQAPAPGFLV